jgi:nitroreductase
LSQTDIIYSKLGANERAIIDPVKIKFLKNLLIQFIGLKLKLQWAGWLQYLMPLPIFLLTLLVAGIAYLLGGVMISKIVFALAGLLSLKLIFDIITVKFKFRPAESRPKRLDSKNVFELMRIRSSCRSFQTRKLAKNDFDELMESFHKHHEEPKLGNKQIRFEYISAPIRVWPVVNGSEFFVAIAPKEYNRLAVMDVGRSLQKIVLDATRMGLATCWIGPGADHKSILSHLGDRFNPEKDNIICVCAVGYKSKFIPLFVRVFSKTMRHRLPLSSLFYSDIGMDKPLKTDEDPYVLFDKCFESCRWAPSSFNGQTTRCVSTPEKDGSLKRFDFYANTSSRYYAAVASGIWLANWEIGCAELNIEGDFRQLTDAERGLTELQKETPIPNYDISWVLDAPIPIKKLPLTKPKLH